MSRVLPSTCLGAVSSCSVATAQESKAFSTRLLLACGFSGAELWVSLQLSEEGTRGGLCSLALLATSLENSPAVARSVGSLPMWPLHVSGLLLTAERVLKIEATCL